MPPKKRLLTGNPNAPEAPVLIEVAEGIRADPGAFAGSDRMFVRMPARVVERDSA